MLQYQVHDHEQMLIKIVRRSDSDDINTDTDLTYFVEVQFQHRRDAMGANEYLLGLETQKAGWLKARFPWMTKIPTVCDPAPTTQSQLSKQRLFRTRKERQVWKDRARFNEKKFGFEGSKNSSASSPRFESFLKAEFDILTRLDKFVEET